MKFTHRFIVRAPQAEVADFHSRASSMAAITPPPLVARIQHAPALLSTGDTMHFTLWAGPLPIRWAAAIEDASLSGFTDRQVRGPFAAWAHRHTFSPRGNDATEVIDVVEARLKRHLFWGPVGALMWAGLPVLFAFRGWKTRRLLEHGRQP